MRRSTWLPGLLGIVLTGVVAAEDRAADPIVREALQREAYGLSGERDALLEQALADHPRCASAHWHLGRVWRNGRWMEAEQVAEQAAGDAALRRYLTRRDDSPDTAAGHLAMADWCGQRGLADRERAHLSRLLELAPDHAAARRRLGFVAVGPHWVLAEELRAAARELAEQEQALRRHAEFAQRLAQRLADKSPAVRERAKSELTELTLEAIPAVERFVSTSSERAAAEVIAWLGRGSSPQAVASLVRHGLLSPWPSIRRAAAEQLARHPLERYVPPLLAALQTPLSAEIRTSGTPNGRIVSRMVLQRETMAERRVLVSDTVFRRINLGGSATAARRNALRQVLGDVAGAGVRLVSENFQTQFNNQLIMALLAGATGELPGATPEDWWGWWNEVNEVYQQGEKSVRTAYRSEEQLIVDQTAAVMPSDCLVAGTTIWTARGQRPVEQIRVGDLVLSQSPDTGELSYKPVLGTSTRPRGPLVQVSFGDEAIACSGGHLFWVSGRGWVKSRRLASGMPVHTPRGAVRVTDVHQQGEAPTYNIVVADFHSYFTGPGRALCHDNTVKQPTAAVVPGLVLASE